MFWLSTDDMSYCNAVSLTTSAWFSLATSPSGLVAGEEGQENLGEGLVERHAKVLAQVDTTRRAAEHVRLERPLQARLKQ